MSENIAVVEPFTLIETEPVPAAPAAPDLAKLTVRCVVSPNGKCHVMPRCIGGCQGANGLESMTTEGQINPPVDDTTEQ